MLLTDPMRRGTHERSIRTGSPDSRRFRTPQSDISVIARVTVDSVDFAIGDAFASVTDVHVDAEGVVPVSVGLVTYFWIGGTVDKRVVDPLRDDDRVDAVSVVDGLEDRLLIRVDWDIERDAFLDTVDDTAGVVLEAHRESDRWSFILPAITS
jgi:hypothetical protein